MEPLRRQKWLGIIKRYASMKPDEQARVQVSPRIMMVAVRELQHSEMFGHLASSQTVFRPADLISLRIAR